MASDRRTYVTLLALCLACGACADTRRFPLRDPLWRDADRVPFAPAPEEYVSPFVWDGANQIVFRPITRFFAFDPARRAVNVNAFDEVPDSSWFTNRIGRTPLSPDDVVRGPCGDRVLDPNLPDGSWIIDKGKSNGANPGFRVNIPGVGKFMLKADPDGEPDRATGATAIAARLYHAAGYFAPCDSVVYFRPSLLALKPGLTVTDNSGVTRPFDQQALDALLAHASHRGELVRMGASRWLPGKPIGPYTYEGMRDDDPNDVIPHEDRRELRGARMLAAWLNHFDSREQNTMNVFITADGAKDDPNAKGYVRHYILDMGDCFGSVWSWDSISRRLGSAYYLDVPYVAEDFITLGLVQRPWERVERNGGIFNYFGARDFDPEAWRGGYPNPAFTRMTEADGAWMARILARFDDEHVQAAVSVGQYDDDSARYLTRVLIERRDAILRRYLGRMSPVADLRVQGDRLCGIDWARRMHVLKGSGREISARWFADSDDDDARALRVETGADGGLCIALEPRPAHDYLVVEIANGYAPGWVRAHLYNLGPIRGYRLVGIERNEP
jgi:hypothetical protein